MLYTKSFTILKDTHTKRNPLVETFALGKGIITFVSVWMPPGCHGLVYCQLKHWAKAIFPSVEDMFLMADGYPLEWNEYYEFYEEPYELKFIGWQYKCLHDHVVTVRIAVLPRKAVLSLAIVDAIKGMFGVLSPRRIFTGR